MNDMPQLIGITGRAGVGKDTLATFINDRLRYVRYAYADPLRALLNARFGWQPHEWENREWKETACRWNGAPFSPRNWMQWLGTEVLRQYAGYDIFIRLAFQQWDLTPYRMVISDVRFTNEAVAIQKRGGLVIEIVRDDVEPVEAHISEHGVPRGLINGTVTNNGTREQLYHGAVQLIKTAWAERGVQLDLPLNEPTVHDLFDHRARGGA